jgi:hypothetical protein
MRRGLVSEGPRFVQKVIRYLESNARKKKTDETKEA